MKKLFVLKASVVIVLLSSLLFSACSKNDSEPTLPSKEYTLYNYSSGSAVNAGSFTIQELADSTASLTIKLSSGFSIANVSLPAYIAKTDSITGVELIYANLGNVDGTSGILTATPVKTSDNMTVNYSTLVGLQGYYVKVMNGTNVQAKGSIQ